MNWPVLFAAYMTFWTLHATMIVAAKIGSSQPYEADNWIAAVAGMTAAALWGYAARNRVTFSIP